MKRLAVVCVTGLTSVVAWAYGVDLNYLELSDLVIVGRVSREAPSYLVLPLLSERPSDGDLPCAIYDVEVLGVIKGTSPTRTLRVLAQSNRPDDYQGKGSAQLARLYGLPQGERLVLFLQDKRSGQYIVERATARVASVAVSAPAQCDYAVAYLNRSFPHIHYLIPRSAPADFGLKGDYPGRDLARVLVRSWREPPQDLRDVMGAVGRWRLRLSPSSEMLKPVKPWLAESPLRALIGPDTFDFYRTEILPLLGDAGPDASVSERIAREVVAGSWGDPDAALRIVDIALSVPTAWAETVASAVSALGHYPGGRDAAARLLGSPYPAIVMAALEPLCTQEVRAKYRDAVKRLLWHEHPGVLCRAITALAFMDNETSKQATYGEDFSPGSENAEVLEYWRNKP